jgi:hypothetical protein
MKHCRTLSHKAIQPKSEGPVLQPVRALERFRAISYSNWLFGSQCINAHIAPGAAFLLKHTRIGKGAMKKFGIDSQRRGELFLFSSFIYQ